MGKEQLNLFGSLSGLLKVVSDIGIDQEIESMERLVFNKYEIHYLGVRHDSTLA